ncbi:MAG: SIS domain-containing protein [Candidatus Limnocylindrales bacterium]
MTLESEILEQPAVAARLLGEGSAEIARIGRAVRATGIDRVIIAARGTSDNAAVYAQYLLGIRYGLVASLAAPSITSVYDAPLRFERSAVIGISQSGESPDIGAVVKAARAQGCPTIAITNVSSSPLAVAAEHVIDLRAGPERSVAATKTYTAQLVAIAALGIALGGGDPGNDPDLPRVPDAIARALALSTEEEIEAIATALVKALAGSDRATVLGRGYEYATAREWGLKLKELALVLADPYSFADVAHGPLALLDERAVVMVVASGGPALPGVIEALERIRRDIGSSLLVLSDDRAARALGTWSVPTDAGLPEWLAPITSIIPAQRLSVALAHRLGRNPAVPRHLTKVTRTR